MMIIKNEVVGSTITTLKHQDTDIILIHPVFNEQQGALQILIHAVEL